MFRRAIFLYNSQKCQRCHSQESWEWTTGKRTPNKWGADIIWTGTKIQGRGRIKRKCRPEVGCRNWELLNNRMRSGKEQWQTELVWFRKHQKEKRRTRRAQAINSKHEEESQDHKWDKKKRGAATEIKVEIGTLCPLEHRLLHSPSFTPKPMFRNSTASCKQISENLARKTGLSVSSDGGLHAVWSQHCFGSSVKEQEKVSITVILFVNRH